MVHDLEGTGGACDVDLDDFEGSAEWTAEMGFRLIGRRGRRAWRWGLRGLGVWGLRRDLEMGLVDAKAITDGRRNSGLSHRERTLEEEEGIECK